MKVDQLAEFLSKPLGVKPGTVIDRAKELRAAGLLSVGKQGTAGAQMTSRDAVNLLLANLLDKNYGESVADNVKRVRDLRNDEHMKSDPAGFVPDLPFFHAATAGDAIDASLDAARSRPLTKWDCSFNVTVESRGDSVLIDISKERSTAVCGFGQDRPRWIERRTTITFGLLLRLACELGRLPD
jgi:hypothetical protein